MRTNGDGIFFSSKQNLASNQQYGINLSITSIPSRFLSTGGNLNIIYSDFKSEIQQINRMGWGIDANLNTTLKLPKDLSVQASGEYSTKKVALLGTSANPITSASLSAYASGVADLCLAEI